MKTTRVFLASITIAAVLSGNTAGYAALTPTETINSAIATVMNILNDPTLQQPGMSDARRAAIERVVRDNVSYQDMARHSLGITWMTLSESEQQLFGNLFVQVLRDAVACRMDEYSERQVVYVSEQREGNLADVRILFSGDKRDTIIDVRLMNRSGRWLMYDAVIDGVRLVENYRAQFVRVMREGSYAGLVGKIEAQTLLHKTFERSLAR